MKADNPEALFIKIIGFVLKKTQGRAAGKEILRKAEKFPIGAFAGTTRARELGANLLIMNELKGFERGDDAAEFRLFEG
jgi:hypothetical protein